MKKKKHWYKPRAYEHVTPKLGQSDYRFVKSYVGSVSEVSRHAFMPLIHSTINERRYKVINRSTGERAHKESIDGKKISTAKERQIYYATHLDTHIYSFYANKIIGPKYESMLNQRMGLSECVTAYRRVLSGNGGYKGNAHFAKDVFDFVKSKGDCMVLVLDISKFFDSLDHALLKRMWKKILGEDVNSLPKDHYNIYKSIINFSFLELDDILKKCEIKHLNELKRRRSSSFCSDVEDYKEKFVDAGLIKKNPFRNNEGESMGIPQGTPLSALLANIYLFDFDNLILNMVEESKGAIYRRYSDDIIIVCEASEAESFQNFVLSKINEEFKLTIHPNKTKKYIVQKNSNGNTVSQVLSNGNIKKKASIEYLGFEYNGEKILLKSASLSKYYRKLKRGVRIRAWRAGIAKKKKHIKPSTDSKIYRKQLYRSYSHLGKNKRKGNYLTYGYRASEIMNEPGIKKQLSKSWKILNKQILNYQRKYKLPRN